MKLTSQAYIELFHLMFLRQFSAQIDAKLYAIKGGCNLRFFFGSVRYSEDCAPRGTKELFIET